MPQADRAPELLAPAGGWQALRAAIASGADAVYLGADRLNARRGAENFTLETVAEACEFAHLRGVRVYLTANVIVLPGEFDDALTLIADAWAAGVDAVILQDLGLVRAVASSMPDVRIHASTQMNVHATSTVRALAEMGVSRVTLARETSLDEIAALSAAAGAMGVEIESFVHGALCVCYSGQCLLSSLIGGRSANRGLCAQPCRLTYELVDEKGAAREAPGAHLLSPKDLAGIGLLPELVASGVASLKIEGRMKSPDYVALVTGTYRAALDRAVAAPAAYDVREGEIAVLSEAFSRGFSEAYLLGERGNDMMSYQRPNNRGVPVGRIVALDGATATIALDTALDHEDTVEVWTGRGRFAQRAAGLVVDGAAADSAPAGRRATLDLSEPAAVGDRVFRVRNAALADAATRTYADTIGPRVPVDVSVRLQAGEPARVTLADGWGREGSARGGVVEPARTKSVEVAEVIEHVGRLGSTPFVARSFDVALSPGVGIGFSELHRVRREAADALAAAMLAPWAGRARLAPSAPALPRFRRGTDRVRLVVVVGDESAAAAASAAGADHVHIAALAPDLHYPTGSVPELPRICHDGEEQAVLDRARGAGGAVAATLGQLRALSSDGLALESHWSLNAANEHTAAALAEIGAGFVWLSPELSAPQIATVAKRSPVPVGIAVRGRQEVMVAEHCVLMALGECRRTCATCARRSERWTLRDRKGYEFPVRVDDAGRTHVYNAVPLDLTHAMGEVLATGVAAVRVDMATEGPAQVSHAVREVRAALMNRTEARAHARQRGDRAVTSGHFFRGVS